jgi:hypothetical protein
MDWLIGGGTTLAVIGLIGLVYCIYSAIAARRQNLDDDIMRARLQKIVGWNMIALLVSTLGLMCVVLGIFLA